MSEVEANSCTVCSVFTVDFDQNLCQKQMVHHNTNYDLPQAIGTPRKCSFSHVTASQVLFCIAKLLEGTTYVTAEFKSCIQVIIISHGNTCATAGMTAHGDDTASHFYVDTCLC